MGVPAKIVWTSFSWLKWIVIFLTGTRLAVAYQNEVGVITLIRGSSRGLGSIWIWKLRCSTQILSIVFIQIRRVQEYIFVIHFGDTSGDKDWVDESQLFMLADKTCRSGAILSINYWRRSPDSWGGILRYITGELFRNVRDWIIFNHNHRSFPFFNKGIHWQLGFKWLMSGIVIISIFFFYFILSFFFILW